MYVPVVILNDSSVHVIANNNRHIAYSFLYNSLNNLKNELPFKLISYMADT